ncbi:MAG: sporulation integral membrane protein YtvI [Lachnospiraceae bacterium]|nr:sporulation integral membrane protein YtvI [Lachnospiraceae bacterium]
MGGYFMKDKDIYKRILVNFLVTLAAVVLVVLFTGDLLRFFLPFVIGFFIAMIANPMVRFLEKKMKVKRKYGSAIIIVLVLAAVVGVLYLIGYILVRELMDLIADLPKLFVSAQELLNELSDKLYGVYEKLPEGVQNGIGSVGSSLESWLDNAVANFKMPSISAAGDYVGGFIEGILIGIISILAAYFFIADRDKLVDGLKRIVPTSFQEYYSLVMNNIKSAIGGYFKAQFKIMLIIIVILFIGFEALGVNYSFLLALLTAFLDLLPVFGTGTIIGPWVVVDIITGKYIEAVVLTVLYLVCQFTKQMLQPKMVGDSIGLNPLLTLFFMFVGYRFGGILGMIIGIPVGMILVNFYRIGIFDRLIRGFKIIAKSINDYRKY